jgi:hypothetical protein
MMAPNFGHTPGGHARPSHIASVPPIRRSARLAGEPPDCDLALYRCDYWTPEGLWIESTRVHNRTKRRWEGDWAYRVNKNTRKKVFFPGQIVLATDPHPQTILSRTLDDPEVAQTVCGPISAKLRAMIIDRHQQYVQRHVVSTHVYSFAQQQPITGKIRGARQY